MIGPLPTAPGGFNRVLVAIDKFTKWIEVKLVTCPKVDMVLDSLDEIVHRYGFPNRIITDLGSNCNNHRFWSYCEDSGIDVRYISVAHPRANGQVERANEMILNTLKKRLHDISNTKGAILPVDVMWKSLAVDQYEEGAAEEVRRVDIDNFEEEYCTALVQSARYLEGIRRYHDRNIKERSFNVGDLVLRRIQNTVGLHKLNSPWEGPYTVAKVTGPGLYRLQTLDSDAIDNSWIIEKLCRFYP
ncbi:uncharacterized protein LOC120680934 [Panicum virgatum]|uniref:uncharacterized protein LOC120680934 n=1 Tax=Panicum virgatum TaxID=38727 RepID=UPI0019D69A32|nr:uncharacterized protein LOC120680934 [Panicum virgatum]